MKKVTARSAAKHVARRLFFPRNWLPLLRCLRRRKGPGGKSGDDAQLKLYGQLLPGGFLNYGYSENPALPPEQLSLDAIQRAQVRYGERLVDLVLNKDDGVLDAGCGMGGLIGLLLRRGLRPTALTPNRTQIRRVRADFPDVPMIEGKLEHLPVEKFRASFGTVITSESFQYVNLQQGLAVIEAVLKPGGRWILCDYFRTGTTTRQSGHTWDDFTAALAQRGWKIISQQDITANVLPTIAFVHMCGNRFGMPVAQFVTERLERKQPALHFLAQDVLGELRTQLQEHLDVVDPAIFAREKKYLTLVMERG
ncbi:MAG: methyltransferase domain-containing protein [Verrucomicrobia bacterium]|nr:methyltransferase domain-containing protein [Verrucomicrobiota bacterium]